MRMEEWEYHQSKIPKNYPARSNFLDELEKKFEREILENKSRYEDYFKPYDPASIDGFIKRYAEHKRGLVEHQEYQLQKLTETKELRYRERTEDAFRMIKQKKLFNMQLLWRAEQIKIPAIRISCDFQYWEEHIDECFFIEPVTEQEVSVMKQFLTDNNFSDTTKNWLIGWQDYDDLLIQDEEGDYDGMPEWYQFYDGRMGTGALLSLPDIRGVKEEEYADLARQEYHSEEKQQERIAAAAASGAKPYVPPPPMLHSSLESNNEFVNHFEDDYFREVQRGKWIGDQVILGKNKKDYEPLYDDEQVDDAIRLLNEADYPVYMPGGYEWSEAIVRCAQQYINKIISEEIDTLFEEYQMLLGIGIGSPEKDYSAKYKSAGAVLIMEQFILRGREIKGEPKDFNF